MNRRTILKNIAFLSGGTLLASVGLFQACNSGSKKRTALTHNDVPLLDEIGETIIPATTSSQGAKAANIGAYMLAMVNDCYTTSQRDIFIEGLNKFNEACNLKYQTTFIQLSPTQKTAFLTALQDEAKALNGSNNQSAHFFNMVKDLTITGYFTSQIGATTARRYELIPGRYHGCIPYKKGDRAWATS